MQRPYCFFILPDGNFKSIFTKQRPFYSLDAVLFPSAPLHFQHTVIPWNSQVRYLGLRLDPKLLFTRHLTSVTHKATGIFLQLFPFPARVSTLSIPNKITLYKLFIRSVLTHADPVWSNTSSSNYRRLQILQSTCPRVIGNYPRHTPIPRLHTALNVAPIRDFIYHLTDNFFRQLPCPPQPPRPLHRKHTLSDLHRQYKKYIHKPPKQLLL